MTTHRQLQRTVTDARAALRERVFVAVSAQDAIATAASIAATPASGLVIVDKVASQLIRPLKAIYPDSLTIATDPATYMRYRARTDRPMDLPAILDSPPMSLGEYMDAQLAGGQDVAFMPAGKVGDHSVLKAVVAAANYVNARNVVLPVALPGKMIKAGHVAETIATLAESRHPVALIVTGQFDPFKEIEVAEGLRAVSELGQIFLHRTDFAAFESIAHGGLGGSIGWCTRLRHAVPGFKPAKTRKDPPDRSPVVVVPDIDSFRHTAIIEPWFRNAAPPLCITPGCCGQDLALLRDKPADHADACEHNVRSWMQIAETLLAQSPSYRAHWLHNYRIDIDLQYAALRRRTGVMTIEMDDSQATWLSLGQ
jgi:hypothetical protein